jgi:hypothetical protein
VSLTKTRILVCSIRASPAGPPSVPTHPCASELNGLADADWRTGGLADGPTMPCAQAIHLLDLLWLRLKGMWPMWPYLAIENHILNELLRPINAHMCQTIHCLDLL